VVPAVTHSVLGVIMLGVIMLGVIVLTVIMLAVVGYRLCHGIADMVWHRLTGAVISAVTNPARQLRNRRAGGVVGDRGGLRHRICVNLEDSRASGQHRLGHVLRRGPMNSGHLENGG
jgi:hypothetical protein